MVEVVNKKSYVEDPYMDQLETQIVKKVRPEKFTDTLLFFVLFFVFIIILGIIIGIYGAIYFKS